MRAHSHTRLPPRAKTQQSSLTSSTFTPHSHHWGHIRLLSTFIIRVRCCRPLQCCAEPHRQSRMPIWLADGGRITTSTPWSATSALKAFSSATSLPSVAAPTVAGRDPGSSARNVSAALNVLRVGFYLLKWPINKFFHLFPKPADRTGTGATATISTVSAAATGGTEGKDTRPERTHTATTEPNNTVPHLQSLGANRGL